MAMLYDQRNVKKAEDAVQSLTEAINIGDKAEAMKYLEELLPLHVPVCVQLCPEVYSRESFRLRVGVEDAVSDVNVPITMLVNPGMRIAELKDKINHDYGFHQSLQCWVIGKRLAKDTETLFSHNVTEDNNQAYLFIRTAQAANLSREQQKQEEENRRLGGIIENIETYTLQARGPAELGARRKQPPVPPKRAPRPPVKPKPDGWSCQQCTYVNKPTRPGCEMCSADRPANYVVPDLYQPDEEEVQRLQLEKLASLQYEQSIIEEREKNFFSLLEIDSQDLVSNKEELECTICLCPVMPEEGATLRECLHSFCKECLKQTIVNCTDAEVMCPYADDAYSCACTLQDREIKTLLSPEEYQKFLELRLSIAESRSENSYHCKTPDCAGWCIFEDDVNEFTCDICNEKNCLLCKAIHKDMNCKEYQDDLRIRAANDTAARKTTEMLEMLVANGEAMYCPKCKVIVQKKDGCDWICCLMCKTEICWVTKQARWGPLGNGDTSGGCKCRVNGVLCHPKCQNCH
ncbi:ranBP-type and C3HC4-type zinc finger-containing protein 1 [Salminus brasiliensis]|uniref:ranBP-type and C3HC4-type zinc finger-containing protein 1 n=1 Tax=Salminus brasiliensis TaxID=930266 RepID=UPI003B837AF6